MCEVLALLLDWATKEGRNVRVLTFDFNKFFDRCILGQGEYSCLWGFGDGDSQCHGGMGRIKCSRAMLG